MNNLTILIICPERPGEFGLAAFYASAFRSLGHRVHVIRDNNRQSFISETKSRVIRRFSRCTYTGFPPDLDGEHLLQNAAEIKPDLTVVIRCERLMANVIAGLSRYSRLGCVNIYPDAPFVIPGSGAVRLAEALGEYSAVFTFSRNLIPVFHQLGAGRVEWLPFAYDTEAHRANMSGPLGPSSFPIAYLGSWGPIQERWLQPLAPLGLRIFGGGWHHLPVGSPLRRCCMNGEGMGARMATAIENSSVTFNLVRAEHGCAHSMKTFEIPACGGFMLTNWTAEQEMFFQDGKECVFFNTVEEMVDKASYFLAHESQREKIRAAGMAAVAPHTYRRRASSLLGYLETGNMVL